MDRTKGKQPAADFGTIIHAGVGEWWTSGDTHKTISIVQTEWQRLRPTGDNHTAEMADKMINAYMEKAKLQVSLPGEGWEVAVVNGVTMIEQRMRLTFPDGVLSFQLDRLLHQPATGNYGIVDTKSMARVSKRWHDGWNNSLQQKLYRAGTRKLLQDAGIEYERLFGVIEGLEKKIPMPIIPHIMPQHTDSQLDEAVALWASHARKDGELITEAMARAVDRHGPEFSEEQLRRIAEEMCVNETDFNLFDCNSYGQPCAYKDLCDAPPEYRADMLWADYDIIEVEGY